MGKNEHQPDTQKGKELMAHELTHTIQQTMNKDQSIQRLKIAHGKEPKINLCSNRVIYWKFVLDKPAPEDGFIVQKINLYVEDSACETKNKPYYKKSKTYWECWKIFKGETVTQDTSSTGFTDLNTTSGLAFDEVGKDETVGTVKFFTQEVTGDLERLWKVGGAKEAGYLYSTYIEPEWWNEEPTEGPAVQVAKFSWDCCDKKRSPNVYLDPKP